MITSLLKWLFVQSNRSVLRQRNFDGNLTMDILDRPVSVYRDHWHIPHIFAAGRADLFRAQGFVHAQDRLWQMEMNRRLGKGELAEAFGEVALDTDRLTRTLGFSCLAQKDWKLLDDEYQSCLVAYAEGVNAFIRQKRFPVEFKLTRIKPRLWEPLDSLIWGRVMAWTLSHGWMGALTRADIVARVGTDIASELNIFYPDKHPVELPDGLEFNSISAEGMLQAVTGPFLGKDLEGGGRGSNAWAVAGQRTASGSPLLCNDTHLVLNQPSTYYIVHLKAGKRLHVAGISLPGIPGVIIGHNDHIAWGITLSYIDCEDIFIEKSDPEHPDHYKYNFESRPYKVRKETIKVKDQDDHIESVYSTIHGPLLNRTIADCEQPLALASMALQPNMMIKGFLDVCRAADWNEFLDALRCIDAPHLNFVYADTQGNTGLAVSGRVPVRSKGNGQLPVIGWTGEYDWVDEIPFEEMPYLLNPESGLIVSANNKIIGDDYPHFLGNSFANGYRARRILEMLTSSDSISMDECARIQMDQLSIPGRELVAGLIRGLRTARPKAKKVIDILMKWDGILDAHSAGGAAYQVLVYTMIRKLVEPQLGKELTDRYMGSGEHPVLVPTNECLGHALPGFLQIIQNRDSKWLTNEKEIIDLVDASLVDTCKWLETHLGFETSDWEWGRLHQLTFHHSLSSRKPLGAVFNVGPIPVGGDTDTVFQAAYIPSAPFHPTAWSPAHRMMIDTGNWNKTRIITAPGQSGVLGSRHYDDLLSSWLKGNSVNLYWDESEIRRRSSGLLKLEP